MRILILLLGLRFPAPTLAGICNANAQVIIKNVVTYTESPVVLFEVETRPSGIGCISPYWQIEETVAAELRAQVLARLLTALAMRQEITVGYDNGACTAQGYIWVARVG